MGKTTTTNKQQKKKKQKLFKFLSCLSVQSSSGGGGAGESSPYPLDRVAHGRSAEEEQQLPPPVEGEGRLLLEKRVRHTSNGSVVLVWSSQSAIDSSAFPADKRFTSADQRFTSADQQFTSADQRFTLADQRFTSADQRFQPSDQKFTSADQRVMSSDQQFTSAADVTCASDWLVLAEGERRNGVSVDDRRRRRRAHPPPPPPLLSLPPPPPPLLSPSSPPTTAVEFHSVQDDKECETGSKMRSDDVTSCVAVDKLATDETLSTEETMATEETPTTKKTQRREIDDDALMTYNVDGEEDTKETKARQKQKFVIMELIDTECDYVKHLRQIVDGYMKTIQSLDIDKHPLCFEGKDKIVFGNIHQIYDWHKDIFQPELENCRDAKTIARLFTKYERRLYMYVKYCENKPKSEFIVAENIDFFEDIRLRLGHRLQLPDLLIKPVQRIMKYQLLLKDMLRCTETAVLPVSVGLEGDAEEEVKLLRAAVHVMHVVPKAANDMMNVGRLQGYNGKITAQGKLLLQGSLEVLEQQTSSTSKQTKGSDHRQVFRKRRVFLFEQIIIFSDEVIDRRKTQLTNARYIYKKSLNVNNMSLEVDSSGASSPLRFIIVDKTPGVHVQLVCQAPDQESRNDWVVQLRSLLDMQGDFLKALQSPIAYQKKLSEGTIDSQGVAPRAPFLRKSCSQLMPSSQLDSRMAIPSTTMLSTTTTTATAAQPSSSSAIIKYSRSKSVPFGALGREKKTRAIPGEDFSRVFHQTQNDDTCALMCPDRGRRADLVTENEVRSKGRGDGKESTHAAVNSIQTMMDRLEQETYEKASTTWSRRQAETNGFHFIDVGQRSEKVSDV